MLCAFADQTFLPGCVQKTKASRVAVRCRSAEHRDRRTDHALRPPGAGLRCERISREKLLLIAYDPTWDSLACGGEPVAPDTAHPSAQVDHAQWKCTIGLLPYGVKPGGLAEHAEDAGPTPQLLAAHLDS